MKKTLYPKTPRIKEQGVVITEKLDGSNLGIFKINGRLLIAQRNNCFYIDELNQISYKGLIGWLEENADKLDLIEGSGVFGEWIGMGAIKYGDSLDKRFYIFAKANINEELEVRNLNYSIELFKYPFISQSIPDCMGVVPVVELDGKPNILWLDNTYDEYKEKVGRNVEGFIINQGGLIYKYVRHKRGVETAHYISE